MKTTKRPKSGAFRRIRQARFIKAYTHCGSVAKAAREVGIDRDTHYEWMKDGEYRREFKEATELVVLKLEDEARQLALYGTERMVFYRGEPVIDPRTGEYYIERRKNDQLLMMLMKALAPEKYREDRRPARYSQTLAEQMALLERTTEAIESIKSAMAEDDAAAGGPKHHRSQVA